MDAGEELADEMELVKAEEAMGEDDGVEGRSCRGLESVSAAGTMMKTHCIWRGFGHSHPLLWGQGLRFEDLEIADVERIR